MSPSSKARRKLKGVWKKYSGCAHKAAAASAAAVFCLRTIPPEMKRRRKPAISACAIDKNGRGGKNIRPFPTQKPRKRPRGFWQEIRRNFLIRAYTENSGNGKNSRLYASFHSRGYAFPYPRGASENAIENSPARRVRLRRNFFARRLRRFKLFRRCRHRGRGDFSHAPRGTEGKAPKNLEKQGKMLARKAFF